jgi:hypothetical protein
VYIPDHNKRFAVAAREEWDGHLSFGLDEQKRYERYFASEEGRTIKNDWTVEYRGKVYQIKKWESLYDGKKVVVRETVSGLVEIYSGKYRLRLQSIKTKRR